MRWLALSIALAACVSNQAAQPSRPPAEFCAAVTAGDLDHAEQSAHGALVESNSDQLEDPSQPLATWLRSRPCVTSVTVATIVIETDPGIREILFDLAPDAAGVARQCVADVRLAPGGQVGIHPANHVTTDPDTRCTARP